MQKEFNIKIVFFFPESKQYLKTKRESTICDGIKSIKCLSINVTKKRTKKVKTGRGLCCPLDEWFISYSFLGWRKLVFRWSAYLCLSLLRKPLKYGYTANSISFSSNSLRQMMKIANESPKNQIGTSIAYLLFFF